MVKVSEDGYTLCYESRAGWHILKYFNTEKEMRGWVIANKYEDIMWQKPGKYEWGE